MYAGCGHKDRRSGHRAVLQAAVLRKSNVMEAAEGTAPQLKERLLETEQALRRTSRKLEDLQAEHTHITVQLQHLATPDTPTESKGDRTDAAEDAGHLLSRVKAHQLDMWHEIERLQQVGPVSMLLCQTIAFLFMDPLPLGDQRYKHCPCGSQVCR